MSDLSDYSYLIPPTSKKKFDEWFLEQEERIARKTRAALVKIIRNATKQFVDSLTASGDLSYFDGIPMEWAAYVDDVLMEELEALYLSGGLKTWMASPAGKALSEAVADQWVSVINQSAVEYASSAVNRMKDVGMTAWNDIKNNVSKSIEDGTSTEQLKELIEQNTKFSEYRADTIARTETSSAYNNGDWAGQQALGEYGPTHKYWVATLDNRARDSHVEMNDVTLPINEPFIVDGEPMMFPHAPEASAGNVINCRCRALFLYPGDVSPETGEVLGDSGDVFEGDLGEFDDGEEF